MVSRGHALSRDELIRTLTAYSGVTTADGAGDGTTLIDASLINNPYISPSGIPEKTILIMSGDARGEDKGAASFNNGNGAITLTGTGFSAQIMAGTIYRILNISSVEIDVATLLARIGTATDNADLGTLFARHRRAYLGTHTHALVVVHDTSALIADLDTALQQWLMDIGFVVTLADPTDVAGELESGSFDLVMVSASCVAGDVGALANLNQVGAPVICHSADIAASVVFDLGATPHTHAAQTEIEITDNTVMFLITQGLGDLVVTASANIYAMNTITAASVELAQVDSHVDDHITFSRLSAGEENEAGYAAFYDRYFVGVGDYTNMNAVWKAVMAELAMHCVMEKRFTEEAVVQVKGVYQEDVPDTDVTDTATTTEAECILLELGPKNNRTYVLRNLRVKAQADPAANTMTVRLYEYFHGTLTEVHSFDIDTANWETYYSLMDMWGLPEIHSDAIKVTCEMDAGTLEVKATYSYAEAKK